MPDIESSNLQVPAELAEAGTHIRTISGNLASELDTLHKKLARARGELERRRLPVLHRPAAGVEPRLARPVGRRYAGQHGAAAVHRARAGRVVRELHERRAFQRADLAALTRVGQAQQNHRDRRREARRPRASQPDADRGVRGRPRRPLRPARWRGHAAGLVARAGRRRAVVDRAVARRGGSRRRAGALPARQRPGPGHDTGRRGHRGTGRAGVEGAPYDHRPPRGVGRLAGRGLDHPRGRGPGFATARWWPRRRHRARPGRHRDALARVGAEPAADAAAGHRLPRDLAVRGAVSRGGRRSGRHDVRHRPGWTAFLVWCRGRRECRDGDGPRGHPGTGRARRRGAVRGGRRRRGGAGGPWRQRYADRGRCRGGRVGDGGGGGATARRPGRRLERADAEGRRRRGSGDHPADAARRAAFDADPGVPRGGVGRRAAGARAVRGTRGRWAWPRPAASLWSPGPARSGSRARWCRWVRPARSACSPWWAPARTGISTWTRQSGRWSWSAAWWSVPA